MTQPAGQAEVAEQLRCPQPPERRRNTTQGEGQLDILQGSGRVEEPEVLKDESDGSPAVLGELVAGERTDVGPVDRHTTALGRLEAAEHGQQG